MFCFDIPLILYNRLRTLFLSPLIISNLSDTYLLYILVIDEIIKLFDRLVWSLRDIVRATEMVKLPSFTTGKKEVINNYSQNRLVTIQQEPSFPLLYNFARHTIHSSESLDIVINTMASILSQYK